MTWQLLSCELLEPSDIRFAFAGHQPHKAPDHPLGGQPSVHLGIAFSPHFTGNYDSMRRKIPENQAFSTAKSKNY
jgi:hypothetical protein